jgi:hypothetical protein
MCSFGHCEGYFLIACSDGDEVERSLAQSETCAKLHRLANSTNGIKVKVFLRRVRGTTHTPCPESDIRLWQPTQQSVMKPREYALRAIGEQY